MTDTRWDMTSGDLIPQPQQQLLPLQNGGDDLTQAVQNAVPVETYDESLLVNSLERTNVTGQSSRLIHQAIPMPSTEEEEDIADDSDGGGDENKTLEETLFDLNCAIHQDHHRTDAKGKDKEATTQADVFAANAGSMFRRAGGYGKSTIKSRKNVKKNDIETGGKKSKSHHHLGSMAHSAKKHTVENLGSSGGYQEMKKLIATNRNQMRSYTRNVILFIILPATAVAFLLFYALGNPLFKYYDYLVEDEIPALNITINNTEISTPELGTELDISQYPSWSWLLLFFVRLVITFGLARAIQYVVVYFCQRTGGCCFLFGPLVRLFIIQGRGFPLQLVVWGLLNFAMLFGPGKFPNHWVYYQHFLDIFNANNASGTVTTNTTYQNILIFGIVVGILVMAKRFFVGLRFGKASYNRYSEKLSNVLKDIVVMTKVSKFANRETTGDFQSGPVPPERMAAVPVDELLGVSDNNNSERPGLSSPMSDSGRRVLTNSQELQLDQLLGSWEDFEEEQAEVEPPSLSSIVQFRASVTVLDSDFVFSHHFGRTKTRLDVIDCSQNLYNRLMAIQERLDNGYRDHPVLKFHTVALTTVDKNGECNKQRATELVRLFRPARNGDISLVDFAKSIDTVYKSVRKLRASIVNDGRMNAASETILNLLFYFALFVIFLAVVGANINALVGLLFTFIIGFALMLGDATGTYLLGLLFIMIQRPYDIGDRISIHGAEEEPNATGAPGWIVKDLTLFHTTVINSQTQEYATIANSAISQSRVSNGARSPQAQLWILVRFHIDSSDESIQEFKEQLTEFVKSKPREWLGMKHFLINDDSTEPDMECLEYKVVLRHRESWQHYATLYQSLADLRKHAVRLSKSLKINYEEGCVRTQFNAGLKSSPSKK